MTEGVQNARDRMLAAYGARFWRWPEARLAGLAGLLTSADFRRRLAEERALDAALDRMAPGIVDGARLERRLLAGMGVADRTARQAPFGFAAPAGLAAASLCLGLTIGALYGGDALGGADYAGLSDTAWVEVSGIELPDEEAD